MGKTAVALYETVAETQKVLQDLVKAGFSRNTIRILLGDKNNGALREWFDDTMAADSARGSGDMRGVIAQGDTVATLTSVGVPNADARSYAEALTYGSALLSVSTTEARIDDAVDIMARYNILDVEGALGRWRGKASGAKAGAATTDTTLDANGETTIPVVEEELRVGKREADRGGVRVRTVVTETPVSETVNLREEHVQVERRPVDRAVSTADVDKLHDQTIEVRETAEEAVVDKQARVVEEVVIRKDVETRQQQVQDTVRHTDVQVEQLANQDMQGWDRYNADFQTDYKSRYAKSGRAYSAYEPAYRYGYDLASKPDWRGQSWSQIEGNARRDWESRNQGAWEDFKDAVRYSWQRITGQTA